MAKAHLKGIQVGWSFRDAEQMIQSMSVAAAKGAAGLSAGKERANTAGVGLGSHGGDHTETKPTDNAS